MSLTGTMVSVTFHNSFRVIFRNVQVMPPHWTASEAGRLVDQDGSLKPAVFQAGVGGRATVEVVLAGAEGGGTGTLRANLGGLILTGTVPLSDGLHRVSVEVQGIGTAIARHTGDAEWKIHMVSPLQPTVALANRTRLEVFVVLGPLPSFFQAGVWAEALRFLVQRMGLGGVSDPLTAVARIARYCHFDHHMSYDRTGLGSAFNVNNQGGTFALSVFLQTPSNHTVNCYDLAAAIQVLSGALGISATWLQLNPFGFIQQTNLIGIGPSNNPLGTSPVVDPLDPGRTYFIEHAFCEQSGMIFDACVGPHLGTHPPDGYINLTVDSQNVYGLGLPSASHTNEQAVQSVG